MRTGQQLNHARRPIPRQRDIAFVIAVKGEGIGHPIEGEVVSIPQPVRDHLTTADVWLESVQHARFRLLDRRVWQRDVLGIHSGIIAGDQIPPAIWTALNRMRVMLAAALKFEQHIRRTIRFVIAVAVAKPQQAFAADRQQIGAMPAHSLNADRRTFRKEFRLVSETVSVGVDQDLDEAVPRHGDPPARVDRQAVNVVSEIVVREQRDLEAFRSLERRLGGRCRDGRSQQDDPEKRAVIATHLRHPSPRCLGNPFLSDTRRLPIPICPIAHRLLRRIVGCNSVSEFWAGFSATEPAG